MEQQDTQNQHLQQDQQSHKDESDHHQLSEKDFVQNDIISNIRPGVGGESSVKNMSTREQLKMEVVQLLSVLKTMGRNEDRSSANDSCNDNSDRDYTAVAVAADDDSDSAQRQHSEREQRQHAQRNNEIVQRQHEQPSNLNKEPGSDKMLPRSVEDPNSFSIPQSWKDDIDRMPVEQLYQVIAKVKAAIKDVTDSQGKVTVRSKKVAVTKIEDIKIADLCCSA